MQTTNVQGWSAGVAFASVFGLAVASGCFGSDTQQPGSVPEDDAADGADTETSDAASNHQETASGDADGMTPDGDSSAPTCEMTSYRMLRPGASDRRGRFALPEYVFHTIRGPDEEPIRGVIRTGDSARRLTLSTYDFENGREVARTSVLRGPQDGNHLRLRRETDYDDQGRKVERRNIRRPQGERELLKVTKWTYQNGHKVEGTVDGPTESEAADGTVDTRRVWHWKMDRLQRRVDWEVNLPQDTYDKERRKTNVVRYEYDNGDRVRRMVDHYQNQEAPPFELPPDGERDKIVEQSFEGGDKWRSRRIDTWLHEVQKPEIDRARDPDFEPRWIYADGKVDIEVYRRFDGDQLYRRVRDGNVKRQLQPRTRNSEPVRAREYPDGLPDEILVRSRRTFECDPPYATEKLQDFSYCLGPAGYCGGPCKRRAPAFENVAAGRGHACGLSADGDVYCWGKNGYGEVGDGTTATRTRPTPVDSSATYETIDAGGATTCGVTEAGDVHCWGENSWGELGIGSRRIRRSPTPVESDATFEEVAVGTAHTCGLTEGGEVLCWGAYLLVGSEARDSNEENALRPIAVDGDRTYTSVTASSHTTCARTSKNELYCWPFLGSASPSLAWDGEAPRDYAVLGTWQTRSGRWIWSGLAVGVVDGDGTFHLYTDTSTDRPAETKTLPSSSVYVGVTEGSEEFCLRTSDGRIECVEIYEEDGKTKFGEQKDVSIDAEVTDLAAGRGPSCARTAEGTLYCWGAPQRGMLASGKIAPNDEPTRGPEPIACQN